MNDMRDYQTRRLLADEATDLLAENGAFMLAVRQLEKTLVGELQNKTMTAEQQLQVCANLRALGNLPAVLRAMTSKMRVQHG